MDELTREAHEMHQVYGVPLEHALYVVEHGQYYYIDGNCLGDIDKVAEELAYCLDLDEDGWGVSENDISELTYAINDKEWLLFIVEGKSDGLIISNF